MRIAGGVAGGIFFLILVVSLGVYLYFDPYDPEEAKGRGKDLPKRDLYTQRKPIKFGKANRIGAVATAKKQAKQNAMKRWNTATSLPQGLAHHPSRFINAESSINPVNKAKGAKTGDRELSC